MIKKYNFENSANKKLMAEILTHRDRQPRAAFLSSLAAVMVAAISLTMVFGSLSTGALPLEQTEQQTNVTSVSDGKTLPPEEVIRVHTETKTETVTLYNDTPQLSEILLVSDTVGEELPTAGKAIFDQEKQLFQWQYNGETFTFYVKDNTVYRRNETTGKTAVVFKGYKKALLFCITDRYLFFGADAFVNCDAYYGGSLYCYRADLINGEILRLFNCIHSNSLYLKENESFIRIDGTDVIFTHYIVHEDGSYDIIPDKTVKVVDEDDESIVFLSLIWNNDNSISAKDKDGKYYDLGISVNDIERLGYKAKKTYLSYINKRGEYDYIVICFNSGDDDDSTTYSWYYGRITDNGIKGGFIQAELLEQPDMKYFMSMFYDVIVAVYDETSYCFPIDFDKLFSDTKSETEYHSFYDGNLTLAITYYPINSLHAATPDSAE